MNSAEKLAKRLQDLFIEGKWIANTNYKEILTTVDWQKANFKHNNLNSIGQLTFHVNYYLEGLNKALEQNVLDISDSRSFDLKTISNEADWHFLVETLLANAVRFIANVAKLQNEDLVNDFVKPQYGSMERNIEALIEHSYYHLGQIVLLTKF